MANDYNTAFDESAHVLMSDVLKGLVVPEPDANHELSIVDQQGVIIFESQRIQSLTRALETLHLTVAIDRMDMIKSIERAIRRKDSLNITWNDLTFKPAILVSWNYTGPAYSNSSTIELVLEIYNLEKPA